VAEPAKRVSLSITYVISELSCFHSGKICLVHKQQAPRGVTLCDINHVMYLGR
jgi:hypothetical protein